MDKHDFGLTFSINSIYLIALFGYTYAAENLALGKTVTLSSQAGKGSPGEFAVLGERSGLMKDGCASTQKERSPWMLLDLEEEYSISGVFIVNWLYQVTIPKEFPLDVPQQAHEVDSTLKQRYRCFNVESTLSAAGTCVTSYSALVCRRNVENFTLWNIDLTDVHIGIGNSSNPDEVGFHNGTVEYNASIQFQPPICGRYVKVWLKGKTDVSLVICGLEVYSQNDWGSWSKWSDCTKSCGNGTRSRSRECTRQDCCGNSEQTLPCNTDDCPACCNCNDEPRDCHDVKDSGRTNSGVYHVTPVGSYTGFYVYCDMETDSGGWLVVQRKENDTDSNMDFDKNWFNYTSGFGDVSSNFWLGLRQLNQILSQGHYELLIQLEDTNANYISDAKYNVFKIGDASTRYVLVIDDFYGTAGDSLSKLNGQPFSTSDRDSSDEHCARSVKGGWWFKQCAFSNLNGVFANDKIWSTLDDAYQITKTEMKIRRV